PTSQMMLSADWFDRRTVELVQYSLQPTSAAKGRVVMCHEGGYSAATVPFYCHRVIESLSGVEMRVFDPYCEEIQNLPYQELQSHQTAVIDDVLKTHKPFGLIG